MRAESSACCSLSMAQGPPKTVRFSPPILRPLSRVMTVSSGWNWRLASLYLTLMRMTRSTPGSSVMRPSSMMPAMPLTPMTVVSPSIVSQRRP